MSLRRAVIIGLGVVVCVGFGPGAPAHAEPATLAISPSLSVLEFTISRPGETIDGQAPKFDGQVRFDPARPGEGSVTLKVDAAAMVTGNRLRDRKMRNSHLETGRFPEIVFRSTALTLASGAAATAAAVLRPGESHQAEIEGTLVLHGQERSIRFPVSIRYDNGSLAAEGGLSLKLTDYAIPIPAFLWMKLDDEVKVHFRFVAARPSAATAGEAPPS